MTEFDQPIERPVYSNAKIAEWHQNGQLSRSEAEVLDILYTHFPRLQDDTDDTELEEIRPIEGPSEHSYVAIVHEGTVIPILDLEEILQRSGTGVEKMLAYTWAASVIIDVLLAFLDEEGA